MGLGLVGGYGALASIAVRYLFPSRPEPRGWLFAVEVARVRPGGSVPYTTPSGESVIITRQGEGEEASDFIALSSTCPHLGCRVHWEPQHDRFFCPCHNGTFDPNGQATGGPPKTAGQNLSRYRLKVENGLLLINVPLRRVPVGGGQSA
jgi:Rieske Fe-S protein